MSSVCQLDSIASHLHIDAFPKSCVSQQVTRFSTKPLPRKNLFLAAALLLSLGAPVFAQVNATPATLKKYNVTVRRFDPSKSSDLGENFILPVDSPDVEHAISAAMSNAVAFSAKSDGMSLRPVAFTCVGIAERK